MDKPSVMATLTLERCGRDFIESMIDEGMTSVRINSAHVTPEQLKEMVASIREVSPQLGILTDTKGAEVRTTEALSPVIVREGQILRFAYGPEEMSTAQCVMLNAPEVERHIAPGQRMLVDDGAVELEVTETGEGYFLARGVRDGVIESRKTVGFPGIDLMHLPSVTERDRSAIIAAREAGVDMIAHSFVRNADDVKAVRRLLEGSEVRLYAKVECRSALENLDEIIDAADGILFARGDLGNAIPLSSLPAVQWRTLARCRERGCPVILSTQILQSMMTSPAPTRAEVNDIFLGVMEGASTFLLCGETATGAYPREATGYLSRTISDSREAFS